MPEHENPSRTGRRNGGILEPEREMISLQEFALGEERMDEKSNTDTTADVHRSETQSNEMQDKSAIRSQAGS
jgi:hypothetical protein